MYRTPRKRLYVHARFPVNRVGDFGLVHPAHDVVLAIRLGLSNRLQEDDSLTRIGRSDRTQLGVTPKPRFPNCIGNRKGKVAITLRRDDSPTLRQNEELRQIDGDQPTELFGVR
jgi:hypothetical protein